MVTLPGVIASKHKKFLPVCPNYAKRESPPVLLTARSKCASRPQIVLAK